MLIEFLSLVISVLHELIPTDMDIDSLAACFVGQSVVGSKSGGVVRKRHAEAGSSRRMKRAARKGSNVVCSSSEDVTAHERSISEGQHVEVEPLPTGSLSMTEQGPCVRVGVVEGSVVGSDGPVVEGIEIAPGVRSIIHGPRPPILRLTEPEGELGWSTLDIRTHNGWTGDGPKPFDTLKAFRIPVDLAYYKNMEEAEFFKSFRARNAEV